ncbi:Putative nitrogen regulatory protein areA, GATA [Septoria linicola]|uniref:Nitrogen regulatory protein areA, GATA n=1 Tax=Septoria linicola TaxID=215465 RepID=A0A9Q9EEJ4_9PEZI|nr:putative nitrogen regulatory protein areA, GATA [Septoria linicola]USW46979.1 Putative nitrogen regulatory protein areA, GATA [Septoria linicola]
MTEVLSLPMQPESPPYFQRSGPLKTSASTSSLFLDKDASTAAGLLRTYTPPVEHQENPHSTSSQWSCPPQTSSAATSYPTVSYAASDESVTNSSNSSVASDVSEDTDITFPNYDGDYGTTKDNTTQNGATDHDASESSTTDTTISESPLPTPTVVDDTAVRQEPSRQVDFLSHEWREEDIWSSWRNIVSQRKTIYGERSRLENASWRTWAKAKFDLRTVSPERLNWLKESDVTWLYGPLKVAASYPISDRSGSQTASQMSKNNSFVHKKPILKKRSVSEVMLQKSLSTSSLVKQAAASVQAQGRHYRRSGPEVVDSKLQSETPSRDQVDYFTSRSTSSVGTPYESHEKRHIRFDDRVEQCIAVDCKDVGGDDEDFVSEGEEEVGDNAISDSSSDDGVVMMRRKKRTTAKRRPTTSRSNSTSGRKIIETLPATTLKYRTDSPDVTEEARHHTFGRSWSTGNLSPSPSQETLRPTNPSTNFLLPADDDDEDEEIESDSSWSFGASNPKSSLGASGSSSSRDRSSNRRSRLSAPAPRHVDYQVEGMRRTESGMFMPLDEDEDDIVQAGLFGRVSETINTARDIAHVIWNVGWRK